jgi:Zn-dependent peptidase ImmA (M78 family)
VEEVVTMTNEEQIARSAWLSVFSTEAVGDITALSDETDDPCRWLSLLGHDDARVVLGAFVLWLRAQPRDAPERIADVISRLPASLQDSARWVASPWLVFPEVSRFDFSLWARVLDAGQEDAILAQLHEPAEALRLRLRLGLFEAYHRNPNTFFALLQRLLIKQPWMHEWVVDLMAEPDFARSLISYDTRLLYFLAPRYRAIAAARLLIPEAIDSVLLAARGSWGADVAPCSYPVLPRPEAPAWPAATWTESDIDKLVAARPLPIDLERLCWELGVGVCRVTRATRWEGAIFWHPEWLRPAIYLNVDQPRNRFRFTWAHELAHLLTERLGVRESRQAAPEYDVESQFSTKREQRINRFASRLLIPAHLIQLYAPWGQFTSAAVSRIAEDCDVSVEAAAYTLADLRDGRGVILVENGTVKRLRMGRGVPHLGLNKGEDLPADPIALSATIRRRFPHDYNVTVDVLARGPSLLVVIDSV